MKTYSASPLVTTSSLISDEIKVVLGILRFAQTKIKLSIKPS